MTEQQRFTLLTLYNVERWDMRVGVTTAETIAGPVGTLIKQGYLTTHGPYTDLVTLTDKGRKFAEEEAALRAIAK
jgi:hypothetical protein